MQLHSRHWTKRYSQISLVVLAGVFILISCLEWTSSDQVKDVIDAPGTTSPIERMEYLSQLRGDDPGSGGAFQTAFNRVKRELQLLKRDDVYQRDAGINTWESLGPDNEGGRVRGLAVNPLNGDQLFAGGVGGGIWKSNDGGSSWNISTPAALAFPITWIAFDPTNGDKVYATSGEFVSGGGMSLPGVGVLKSTDNGNSWTVLPVDPNSDFWLSKIIVNPLDPDILYVCGSSATVNQNSGDETIYRSNDAGLSWQLIYSNDDTGRDYIFDIEINPIDTSEIYIGTDEGVWKSTDSGNNFVSMSDTSQIASHIDTFAINDTMVANPERCDVSICSSDPDNVYVLRYLTGSIDMDNTIDSSAHSEIWYTSDGGDNWTMLVRTTGNNDEETTILNNQGGYDNIAWADPDNCSRAVFGGVNLWKWENNSLTRISDDDDDIGGANGGGNNSVHADQHNIVPHSNYGPNNKEVFIANDGGVYKAGNIWTIMANDTAWKSLVPGLNITQLYAVDVSLTGDTVYGGSQDNSYFVNRSVSTNGTDWVVTVRADGGHGAIKKSDPEVIYASTQNGVFRKSTDGGDSYSVIFNLEETDLGDDNPLFIAPFEMDPNDDETLFTGGERVWQSTDEGANWTVFKSDTTEGRQVSTIEIAKGNGSIVWVGYDDGEFWRTPDGGSSWFREDEPVMPNNRIVTDIAINPNNHNEILVVIGGGYNTNRVWYSSDNGSSWINRSLDFPMQMYCALWHPVQTDWAYVGTDLGVFATENAGQDWTISPLSTGHPSGNDSDGPAFTAVTELVWQGDGTDAHPYYLVAATHGRGIWRSTFPIRSKYYVDKNCDPCGHGSFTEPYATFREAVEAAGSGSEIIFLSGGTYDEIPATILIEKRIKVTLHPSLTTSVVIE